MGNDLKYICSVDPMGIDLMRVSIGWDAWKKMSSDERGKFILSHANHPNFRRFFHYSPPQDEAA